MNVSSWVIVIFLILVVYHFFFNLYDINVSLKSLYNDFYIVNSFQVLDVVVVFVVFDVVVVLLFMNLKTFVHNYLIFLTIK